jgi:hypothetical protein
LQEGLHPSCILNHALRSSAAYSIYTYMRVTDMAFSSG